ncbi:MAG: histidinol dehydrogenase, partial [Saccharopolyspora sp.]|nr:histidinol dehydrogenase [Saccharopolyspora sp.]
MRFAPSLLRELGSSYRPLKTPAHEGPAAQRDPAVMQRVSEMLAAIERDGMDAVLRYASELDGWTGAEVEL